MTLIKKCKASVLIIATSFCICLVSCKNPVTSTTQTVNENPSIENQDMHLESSVEWPGTGTPCDKYFGPCLVRRSNGQDDLYTYSITDKMLIQVDILADDKKTTRQYDKNGRLILEVSPNGHSYNWIYNKDGNLVSATAVSPSHELTQRYSYVYVGKGPFPPVTGRDEFPDWGDNRFADVNIDKRSAQEYLTSIDFGGDGVIDTQVVKKLDTKGRVTFEGDIFVEKGIGRSEIEYDDIKHSATERVHLGNGIATRKVILNDNGTVVSEEIDFPSVGNREIRCIYSSFGKIKERHLKELMASSEKSVIALRTTWEYDKYGNVINISDEDKNTGKSIARFVYEWENGSLVSVEKHEVSFVFITTYDKCGNVLRESRFKTEQTGERVKVSESQYDYRCWSSMKAVINIIKTYGMSNQVTDAAPVDRCLLTPVELFPSSLEVPF